MTDCEGKDVQVGDAVITGFRNRGGGIKLVKGKILKFTKLSVSISWTNDYGYLTDAWFKTREVFKIEFNG